MRKAIIAVLAGGALLLSATNAFALISVSADVPVAYSFDESVLKDPSVSGFKLGVTLPFFVGLGLENYKVTGKAAPYEYDHKVTMYDIFLDIPFPFVNLGAGIGAGTGKFELTPVGGSTPTFDDANLSQYFVTLGWPFLGIFDAHLGYHKIGGKAEGSGAYKGLSVKLDATMYTLGLKVGF